MCNLGNGLDINIFPQQQSNAEKWARAQANSKKWFGYTSGRITASKVFSVVHTHDDRPSRSLIMSICYPESYKSWGYQQPWELPAISWGCSHQEQGYNSYRNIMIQNHLDFQLAKNGLIITTEFPFIGAFPDGLVLCSCCGKGCVEIKCAFNQRDNYIFDNFYLTKMNNSMKLSVIHQYYHQIQTQIHVTKK